MHFSSWHAKFCFLHALRIIPLLCTGLFALTSTSQAHDGGFGHSRRLIYVSADAKTWTLEYRLKQGLEEGLVELTHIDTNHDGTITPAERDSYFQQRGKALLARLSFRDVKSGQMLQAELVGFELQHSLVQVYRIRVAGAGTGMLLEDRNFPHKPGQVGIEVDRGLTAELPEEIDLTHADHVRVILRRADQ